VPVYISPRNRMAQSHSRALGSLSVASYDSQGNSADIPSRLRTRAKVTCCWLSLIKPRHGSHRNHRYSFLYHVAIFRTVYRTPFPCCVERNLPRNGRCLKIRNSVEAVSCCLFSRHCLLLRPTVLSSDESFWLQIRRSQAPFPALPDFLSSSGTGKESTKPREDK
jgi:hypothetical protein